MTDDPSGVADVSLWEPAGDEYLGTKPKQWFRDGDGRLWLGKQSTFNVGAAGAYRKGDDWAELIAGRIGTAMGIPVATVRLAGWGEKATALTGSTRFPVETAPGSTT